MGPLLIAAAAASVLGAIGQIQKGAFEKQIYDENAKTAELNAQYAKISAADQAFRIRYAKRITVGEQYTGFARGGVAVHSGSAADVTAETARQYELDALKAEINGNVQESAFLRQADILRRQGKFAVQSSYLAAFSNLGNTALNMYGVTSGGGSTGPSPNVGGFDSPSFSANDYINLPGGR